MVEARLGIECFVRAAGVPEKALSVFEFGNLIRFTKKHIERHGEFVGALKGDRLGFLSFDEPSRGRIFENKRIVIVFAGDLWIVSEIGAVKAARKAELWDHA